MWHHVSHMANMSPWLRECVATSSAVESGVGAVTLYFPVPDMYQEVTEFSPI